MNIWVLDTFLLVLYMIHSIGSLIYFNHSMKNKTIQQIAKKKRKKKALHPQFRGQKRRRQLLGVSLFL